MAEELDSISSRTTVLRSLFLLRPTDTTFIDSDELLEHMREDLEEEREEIYEAQELYVTLGVLDRDTSYFDLVLAILGEGVLGFFDTEVEKLYVVLGDNDELKPNDALTYAHEYVHNLQQQHFDIYQIREELEDNSDKARALRALIEGDATVSETLYFLQHLDEAEQRAVQEAFQGADLEAFRSAPHLIQRTRLFPYREGFQFVAALFQSENSFDRVNDAYSKLPESTEQILHPQKYVFEEGPVTVELPDIADSLGEGWTMLRQDTLGEFILRAYLEPNVPPELAAAAAEGWGGDTYVLWKGPEEANLLVSKVTWDTEEDAQEFYDAFLDFIEAREGIQWETSADDEAQRIINPPDQSILLTLSEKDTLVIFAPDSAILETAVAALEGN